MTPFRPSPGCWLKHNIAGHGWVASDASIGNCGFRDQMFTMICYPSGRRLPVLASSCEAAGPPKNVKPRVVIDNETRVPCDGERA